MNLLPILLAAHVTLAVALFLPSILLPLAMRRRPGVDGSGAVVRTLLFAQSHGTLAIGLGLAASGVGLLTVLGSGLLGQPWLLVALVIYALNLGLAFFIQRPNLRRLLGMRFGDDATWRERARRQRYVSYAMAALVGTIGALMTTKPDLW